MSRHRATPDPRRFRIRGGVLASHTRSVVAASVLAAATLGAGGSAIAVAANDTPTSVAASVNIRPVEEVTDRTTSQAASRGDRPASTLSQGDGPTDQQVMVVLKQNAAKAKVEAEKRAAAEAQAAAEEAARKAAEEKAAAEAAAKAAEEKAAADAAAKAAEEKAAAEKAAAKKAAAAKAAEEKAAAAEATEDAPAASTATATASASGNDYKQYALSKVSASEFTCLEKLWGKESGWNPNAQNPTSTAYGIAQFLNSTWAGTGIAKTSDGFRQIDAGLIYLDNRYGSPCGGWAHSQATGWY